MHRSLSSLNEVQTLLGPLSCFLDQRQLNDIQRSCFRPLLLSDINMVIAAPTGSGKTLLMELAMIRLFAPRLLHFIQRRATESTLTVSPSPANNSTLRCEKVVYLCPTKSLAQEKATLWEKKYGPYELCIVMETGDTDRTLNSLTRVCAADVLVTTPERWDSITRGWKEGAVLNLVTSVALVLIDEVHTLHDDRGAALEALVSRMKTVHKVRQSRSNRICIEEPIGGASGANDKDHKAREESALGDGAAYSTSLQAHGGFTMRFIAVSGTLSNAEDIAAWLEVPDEGLHVFSESLRPIELHVKVLSFGSRCDNPFSYDRLLSYKLAPMIEKYSDGKPTLIFCASRKEAENSCLVINQHATHTSMLPRDCTQRQSFLNSLSTINNTLLRQCMEKGLGFHHAALSPSDRRAVEKAFSKQFIRVVCCTTTLAVGVNFPARLVIVKGTTGYKGGSRVDLPLHEVRQMLGRAGRPGLDTSGVGLVLTTENKVYTYNTLTQTNAEHVQVIESKLYAHLGEHINSDIALLTINSIETAKEWLRTTYFWVRVNKNPTFYGVERHCAVDQFITDILEDQLQKLRSLECVYIHVETGTLRPSRIGKLVAKYYILLQTLRVVRDNMGPTSDIKEVLQCISKTEEMHEYHIHQGDKQHLNPQNKTIRFPIPGQARGRNIREDWQKIFILIQLRLADENLENLSAWSLKNELGRMWTVLPRVCKFIQEYSLEKKWFGATRASWSLLRCVERSMWETSPFLTRELAGIGPATAKLLAQYSINNFADLLQANPRTIEHCTNKKPPFGSNLQRRISSFPFLNFFAHQTRIDCPEISREVKFYVGRCSPVHVSQSTSELEGDHHGGNEQNRSCLLESSETLWYSFLVGDSNGKLLLYRRFRSMGTWPPHSWVNIWDKHHEGTLDPDCVPEGVLLWEVNVPHLRDTPWEIYATLVCEDYLGYDRFSKITLELDSSLKQTNATSVSEQDGTLGSECSKDHETRCNKKVSNSIEVLADTVPIKEKIPPANCSVPQAKENMSNHSTPLKRESAPSTMKKASPNTACENDDKTGITIPSGRNKSSMIEQSRLEKEEHNPLNRLCQNDRNSFASNSAILEVRDLDSAYNRRNAVSISSQGRHFQVVEGDDKFSLEENVTVTPSSTIYANEQRSSDPVQSDPIRNLSEASVFGTSIRGRDLLRDEERRITMTSRPEKSFGVDPNRLKFCSPAQTYSYPIDNCAEPIYMSERTPMPHQSDPTNSISLAGLSDVKNRPIEPPCFVGQNRHYTAEPVECLIPACTGQEDKKYYRLGAAYPDVRRKKLI